MDDFISRAEAVALAMEYCPDDDGVCSKAGHDLRELLDDLESAPPADVRPVVRGEWVEEKGRLYRWHCSECGYVIGVARMDANFCPNCGADMREAAT